MLAQHLQHSIRLHKLSTAAKLLNDKDIIIFFPNPHIWRLSWPGDLTYDVESKQAYKYEFQVYFWEALLEEGSFDRD